MAETNASDPSGLLSPQGSSPTIIKIVNTARMDLNDSFGFVHSYNGDRSRYIVTLLPTNNATSATMNNPTPISLKAENIQKASFIEKAKIQGLFAYQTIKQQYNNPQVQTELRRHYTSAKDRLGFKPEYLMYGLVVLFFITVRLFGFAKVIMASSFSSLVVFISAPDWLNNRSDFKTTIRNFPMRWRDSIVRSTGFHKLSTKMALGLFFALFLFTVKALFFVPSNVNYNPSNSAARSTSGYDLNSSFTSPPSNARMTQLLEEMYKFGYDDAKNDNAFGTSLPENLEALINNKIPSPPLENGDVDDLDWNNLPPPASPKPRNNFGMGTMLSCFTLFRMLKEMATSADGEISFPLLLANLKMADPWKLGIFALCTYKIASAFLF